MLLISTNNIVFCGYIRNISIHLVDKKHFIWSYDYFVSLYIVFVIHVPISINVTMVTTLKCFNTLTDLRHLNNFPFLFH